jgi:phospholipid-binding lipoprotein MlaA
MNGMNSLAAIESGTSTELKATVSAAARACAANASPSASRSSPSKRLLLGVVASALLATGCASTSPNDPFEPLNRAMFGLNKGVDEVAIKPLASGYQAIVPSPIRSCVGGVFGHFNDFFVVLNNALQGKVNDTLDATGRVVVNTFPGMFGCFDIASQAGLDRQNEDFGQTLGRWGVGDGPYLVLPFYGPSNLRDAVGTYIYSRLDPIGNISHVRTRNALISIRAIDQRSRLLQASDILSQASPDEYVFTRDAYLQRRRYLIHDGNPPPLADNGQGSFRPMPLAFAAAVPVGINPADGAHQPLTRAEQRWAEDAPNQRAVLTAANAAVKARALAQASNELKQSAVPPVQPGVRLSMQEHEGVGAGWVQAERAAR